MKWLINTVIFPYILINYWNHFTSSQNKEAGAIVMTVGVLVSQRSESAFTITQPWKWLTLYVNTAIFIVLELTMLIRFQCLKPILQSSVIISLIYSIGGLYKQMHPNFCDRVPDAKL